MSLFLIILILLVNQNIHIYLNRCHGESIGYTVNVKKFNYSTNSFPEKHTTTFRRDNCCKDVLIKSNDNSFFSVEKSLQITPLVLNGILTDFNFNLFHDILPKEKKVPQLYSKPPPDKVKLYQYYCRYTYYS